MEYQSVDLTSNTPMNLYIDNDKINRQEAGITKSYDLKLTEGKHKIYMKNDGIYKTDVLEFEVDSSHTSFKFGAKTRLTFGVKIWEK